MREAGGDSTGCERLQKALCECHQRFGPGATRDAACRHLNRALAECLVSVLCPAESEAVRTLCASGGTRLKRSSMGEEQAGDRCCHASFWKSAF
ncbi:hypothetical protein QQP08_019376 [Theobroma cacao]|nr:hypothetical protein QQP08_019376 [Theobroma cacao]